MSERGALDQSDVPAAAPASKEWWRWMLAPAVLGAILGAIPTGIDLYKSFDYDIGYGEVKHAEQQRQLWIKNFDCTQSMTYQRVQTRSGIHVQVGGCPNGDVLIEVKSPNGGRVVEWIPVEQARSAANGLGISLFGTALAAVNFGGSRSTIEPEAGRLAQASVVCQAMQGSSRIIRVVRENGKCFREEIETLKGKVVNRAEVACSTKCS